jgi:hypothetical protein
MMARAGTGLAPFRGSLQEHGRGARHARRRHTGRSSEQAQEWLPAMQADRFLADIRGG